MPDILSHLICAEEALKSLSHDIKATIEANRHIYNLGAQGPDLFFYYKIYPWQNPDDFDSTADLIHKEKTNEFFMNGADFIRNHNLTDPMEFFRVKDKTTDAHKYFSYLAGFLSHYALDTYGHPFIFYYSGHDGGHNHKYFECILDTILSDIYGSKKSALRNTGRAIGLKGDERFIIASYLSSLISQTFNKEVPQAEIQVAMKDMKRVMMMMFDPKKIKRTGIKAIDRLAKTKGKITTAIYPAKYNKKVDHLNLKHQNWCHPCDESDIRSESFLDLMKTATTYSGDLTMNLALYIIKNIDADALSQSIGHMLYDTGYDASKSQEMFFDDPIVDYKKTFKIK